MKRFICLRAVVVLIGSLAFLQTKASGQTPAAAGPDQARAMVTTYCVGCHNNRAKVGGLALDSLDLQTAPDDAQTW